MLKLLLGSHLPHYFWRLAECLSVGLLALGLLASSAALGANVELAPLPAVMPVEGLTAEFEAKIPELFRLPVDDFEVAVREVPIESKSIEIWHVTFPSAMKTESPANNTVHGEFYRPKMAGQRPAVIVLHILGGDLQLSRVFCNHLAQNGSASMLIHLPYYGNRRAPGESRRMISEDPDQTVVGMRQAVMDIRRGISWFESQRETIDPQQTGIFGISLGGITSALAAAVEPRIENTCLLLAGADLGRIAWESKELAKFRRKWVMDGFTKDQFTATLKPIDPITYAANLKDRRVLMLNAEKDEVIHRDCTLALWQEAGEPAIKWYPGGHYSVIRHLFSAMHHTSEFFSTPAMP